MSAPPFPDLAAFERYRPLLRTAGGWESFRVALGRPLPTVVWANPSRAGRERLGERLSAAGVPVEPVSWYPGAFRLPAGTAAGNLVEYVTGWLHVQEEASLVPVVLLDPQPGERVADLCAAPGGKTAQIAARLDNRGTVVANDRDSRRLLAVRKTLDRLGMANVATTCWDAASYPREAGLFDRVLADVPCTCEGTSRKNPEVLGRAGPRGALLMQGLQRAILTTAVRLCRPGGRIVYSTCSYAPEENEAVVDAVLEQARGQVRLVPARLPGLRASPGLVSWEGQRFAPELAGALRLWPQQNDTGGFFVAVLEKARAKEGGHDDDVRQTPGEPPGIPGLEGEERAAVLGPLEERFGLPGEVLSPLAVVAGRGRKLFAASRDLTPPSFPEPLTVGIPFLHAGMRQPKLTTAAALLLGGAAKRNVVTLEEGQEAAFLGRRDLRLAPRQLAGVTGSGHVLVRVGEVDLGTGLVRLESGPGGGGLLVSFFPKAWAPGAGG